MERTDFSFSSYRPVPSILTVQLSPFPLALIPLFNFPVYSEKEKGGNSFLNFLGNIILPLASLRLLYVASVSESKDQEFEFTKKSKSSAKIEYISWAKLTNPGASSSYLQPQVFLPLSPEASAAVVDGGRN